MILNVSAIFVIYSFRINYMQINHIQIVYDTTMILKISISKYTFSIVFIQNVFKYNLLLN